MVNDVNLNAAREEKNDKRAKKELSAREGREDEHLLSLRELANEIDSLIATFSSIYPLYSKQLLKNLPTTL